MSYVIDKNVPIPAQRQRGKYPFRSMEVGDSFMVYGRDVQNARVAASLFAARTTLKFRSKKEGDGIRIWRIA